MDRKIAVISGGSSGIGRACAEIFAKGGYQVYELSRSGADRSGIRHLDTDVTDLESVHGAFAQLDREIDGIDVLIVSAGYGIAGPIECSSDTDMTRQFEVNVFGAIRLVQGALPLLRKRRGRTFFISSVAAELSLPFQAFYSASKSCLNHFALALNNELRASGLTFTAVMPGDLATAFTKNRIYPQTPEEAELYGDISVRAIQKMSKDELAGSSPEGLARFIFKLAHRKRRPRALVGYEFKYRLILFLAKLLPTSISNALMGRIYAR